MKNGFTIFMIVLLVFGLGSFLIRDSGVSNKVDGGNFGSGEIQKVVLNQDRYNYKDAFVEAGKPISLSADSSVTGCLRSVVFNLDGKRYVKYLKTPKDTLELPALSKGIYNFACSMGMGYGKLIVK
ncbi:hypothetical protein COT60_01705 [Candidatus Pacearchaeota archaeon CG09_land_8_20_14_0_10_30_9]|nr:MAG: hypothetical protein AUJ61_01845 [Candidatus Pacearchaeota archaeon CG1_02_30_18]PIN71229.1 MAG: hypothetical protein COV77_03080 [Candidatus Pacearchaeota archaeon CG11_big_fil_rev_8_21_14_0_20_30_13]PIO01199.1 MAG: hypothetical protein COT60_01705 [Candidatus Pacearchaeota archaeon CG09_land_8_20_14_0_10_30_9]PIZ81925.1 MAG: hypothetical protein COX98_01900 [Candidatus Pacearchaeota archaeon CG_4_10_14_0_2_um_filter_30_11]PJA71366.1 MAG: hypothetical protein CO153_02020 [Candidatus Pa